MSGGRMEEASRWMYQGIWAVLVRWFKVPEAPPTLPVAPGEALASFRPAPGFLRYLKLCFWVALTTLDGVLVLAWLASVIALPLLGFLLFVPLVVFVILPDILAYIAIHLRYDTTWYVLSARSLRIRRGIWVLHETTITFENVQNVAIEQGPVQRYFGIADVVVQTAGGGAAHGAHGGAALGGGHVGRLEGVSNASELRDLILQRVRASRSAGLGDESAREEAAAATGWSPAHLETLREIRAAVRALSGEAA